MPTAQANGHAIRSLRLSKNWTQQDLSEASGVSRRTIQSVEAGGYALPRAVFQPLADAFGVERSELILGPEPEEPIKEDSGGYHVVGLKVQGDFENFDQVTDLPPVINTILNKLPNAEYVLVVRVRPGGSIIIEVEMRDEIIAILLGMFRTTELDRRSAAHAEKPRPSDWFTDNGIIAFLLSDDFPFSMGQIATLFCEYIDPLNMRPPLYCVVDEHNVWKVMRHSDYAAFSVSNPQVIRKNS